MVVLTSVRSIYESSNSVAGKNKGELDFHDDGIYLRIEGYQK